MNFFLDVVHRPGSVVGFTGLMGSGKTGTMTLCAARQARAGYAIRANYDVSFAQRITSADQLYCDQTCLLIDELQLTVNARAFANKMNLSFSAWLELDVRKRDNIFFFTAQDIDLVDVNVRRLMAFLVDCQFVALHSTNYTRVRVFQNARYGSFAMVQEFLFPQSWFYGWYNTRDRDVLLTDFQSHTNSTKQSHTARPALSATSRPFSPDRPTGREGESPLSSSPFDFS